MAGFVHETQLGTELVVSNASGGADAALGVHVVAHLFSDSGSDSEATEMRILHLGALLVALRSGVEVHWAPVRVVGDQLGGSAVNVAVEGRVVAASRAAADFGRDVDIHLFQAGFLDGATEAAER